MLECGLLKPSFVPPPAIRELRDLRRYRLQQVRDRSQEVNRLCKVLEDAGLKLTTVITDVMGVSGPVCGRSSVVSRQLGAVHMRAPNRRHGICELELAVKHSHRVKQSWAPDVDPRSSRNKPFGSDP